MCVCACVHVLVSMRSVSNVCERVIAYRHVCHAICRTLDGLRGNGTLVHIAFLTQIYITFIE